MDTTQILEGALSAFAGDLATQPPMSLRGGDDLDSYRAVTPFDASIDEPTDEYLEGYAYWGLIYLDARSWRHYLPRLIGYALRHPNDHRMVAEALVHSLRPPDRYPPRLASLTEEQERVVTAFLEHVAIEPAWASLQEEAQQALQEWWWPNPSSRPSAADVEALRRQPVVYREAGEGIYRIDVPVALTGSGVRDIPEESRRVETWGGYLCGDAHTAIAVNVTPLSQRSLAESVAARRGLFSDAPEERHIIVPAASRARRMVGHTTMGGSPAEPQVLTLVLAVAADHLVTLSIRTWPRDDLAREVDRIVASFKIVPR